MSDSALKLSDNLINSISRSTKPQWADFEEKLYSWVETLRFEKIPISPSLVISKAKGIAEQLSYSADFKESFWWYSYWRKTVRNAFMKADLKMNLVCLKYSRLPLKYANWTRPINAYLARVVRTFWLHSIKWNLVVSFLSYN